MKKIEEYLENITVPNEEALKYFRLAKDMDFVRVHETILGKITKEPLPFLQSSKYFASLERCDQIKIALERLKQLMISQRNSGRKVVVDVLTILLDGLFDIFLFK